MSKVKFAILFMFVSLICFSQNSTRKNNVELSGTDMPELTINKEFEKFDFKTFDAKKNKDINEYVETSNLGSFIRMAATKLELYYKEIPENSAFCILKVYYPNGNIKEKGLAYVRGFQKAIWYYYNEEGKLVKEINYDEPFKFAFENLLIFCKNEGIPVAKGNVTNGL